MTPRNATLCTAAGNDLLIRRSWDRSPPGSFELRPVEQDGVRGLVREAVRFCARCSTTKPLDAFGQRRNHGKTVPQSYCRGCMVGYHRDWRATPAGGERFKQKTAETRARYPERHRARHLVRAAVASGRLERGPCCLASASCHGVIDAHHDDYEKPLEVRWVCRGHHRQLDRERRAVHGAVRPLEAR